MRVPSAGASMKVAMLKAVITELFQLEKPFKIIEPNQGWH